jgi:hypothetical protein
MDRRLIDAMATLLGPQAGKVGQTFLHQLDVSVIRRAYRRLAMATHPDAVRQSGGRSAATDGKRFIEASQAYELLMGYLLGRLRSAPAPASSRPARPAPPAGDKRTSPGADKRASGEKRGTGDKRAAGGGDKRAKGGTHGPGAAKPSHNPLYYRGPLPRRKLRLAEFLYYSGRVPWQSLIAAIVWQRAVQPRFGELAKELRSITGQELIRILGAKRRGEQTGETARRLQLLTAEEVARVLRMQRARHKPIGRYFVENERMPSAELTRILRELYRHNARYGKEP